MITPAPDFMEWVEVTEKGWKLKPGAPESVKQKFNDYLSQIDNKVKFES
jgi:hypothetical protein